LSAWRPATLEEAGERSRESLRTRWGRVAAAWRTMVQAAVAASLAWLIATRVWGHGAPFFAPVSAITALGQSYVQRGRRAVELAIGVSLGIAIADVLLSLLGTGVLQLGLVVFIGMGLGLFFGSTPLFVGQAATSAALVATLMPPSSGISFARSVDALTGGMVALAIGSVLLPRDPLRMLRTSARRVIDELAGTLDDVADALAARDHDGAIDALARARTIDALGARLLAAVDEGRETTRYAPAHRGTRAKIDDYAEAAAQIDLAVRNTRVLARGAIRALDLDAHVPPGVAEAVHELARAVRAMPATLSGEAGLAAVREPAEHAAAEATRVLEGTGNLSVSVLVGQVRSTAVDLLVGAGLDAEAALAAVRRVQAP